MLLVARPADIIILNASSIVIGSSVISASGSIT